MKTSSLLVAILPLLFSAALYGADCFYLQDSTGKVIYEGTQPPFDISTPPVSQASAESRTRGEHLIIMPCQPLSAWRVPAQEGGSPSNQPYPASRSGGSVTIGEGHLWSPSDYAPSQSSGRSRNVYVRPYYRSDGTPVRGYYRSRPSR